MATDVSPSGQAFAFFAMVLCGILCGIVFDFFRSLRRIHKSGSGVVALQDILFWLIELAFVYFAAFRLNYARLRAYEAVALVIGSLLYFMMLSPYALKLFCTVIAFLAKVALCIARPFATLAKKIKNQLREKALFTARRTRRFLTEIKISKKLVNIADAAKKNIKKHLYNLR